MQRFYIQINEEFIRRDESIMRCSYWRYLVLYQVFTKDSA